MSAISDYAGRVKVWIQDVREDIQGLKDKIEQIQNNPGPISDEDQKLLDETEAGLKALAEATATPPKTPA